MKKIWKNLNLIAGIECIVLILIVFIGAMAYRLELERERADYETFMRKVMDWEYYISGDESDLYDIFSMLNSYRTGKEYGIAMRLNGTYQSYETTTMNQILSWTAENTNETRLVQLGKFFSDDIVDGLTSFYYEYEAKRWEDEKRSQMEMQKMQGYYSDLGEFIPVEIVFGEIDSSNVLYTITNEKTKAKVRPGQLFWRFNIENASIREEARDNEICEYGSSWVSFNETERIYNEKARLKLSTGEYSMGREIVTGRDTYEVLRKNSNKEGEIQSYRVSFYADLDSITLHSGEFHKDMMMITTFCQLVGLVVIICVLFINKRRLHLQQMRNTFINAMAHEMKTPAAVVKSGAECIREGVHPEKQAHYIELINREADHMSDLLNAMLVYTKVADTGYRLKKECFCMDEICQETFEHYQSAIKEKEIVFVMTIIDSFNLKGDPHLLAMVVDNFLSNAVRHCPPGKTIRLDIYQNSLFVFNTGEHIPDAGLDRIWEPLYQVDAARSGESSSSGMGLAISAQILKLHHIKYGAKNVQDGVEFYIGL